MAHADWAIVVIAALNVAQTIWLADIDRRSKRRRAGDRRQRVSR